jgi:hypothetical protein
MLARGIIMPFLEQKDKGEDTVSTASRGTMLMMLMLKCSG